MSFIWPQLLLALLAIPVGVAVYIRIGRRRSRMAAAAGGRFATVAQRPVGGPRAAIPVALFLAGLVLLTVGLARPQSVVGLPAQVGTVILAIDVSGSMAADDLKPTRMDAVKAATEAFVQRQPSSVVVGVVAFSDSGLSVQTPTTDQATVLAALKRLAPQRGTSLGQGIQASLTALTQSEAGTPPEYYSNRSPQPTPSPVVVAPGSHTSAAIILLTDGENNERPDPIAAAQAAADLGIRIYTVGIGSDAGATLDLNGFRIHTQLNAPLLQQIADTTGGQYFSADNAQDLRSIYDHLNPRLLIKSQNIELTAILAGVAVLLLVLGGATSLRWLGRLP